VTPSKRVNHLPSSCKRCAERGTNTCALSLTHTHTHILSSQIAAMQRAAGLESVLVDPHGSTVTVTGWVGEILDQRTCTVAVIGLWAGKRAAIVCRACNLPRTKVHAGVRAGFC